jgi:hypothetical protein
MARVTRRRGQCWRGDVAGCAVSLLADVFAGAMYIKRTWYFIPRIVPESAGHIPKPATARASELSTVGRLSAASQRKTDFLTELLESFVIWRRVQILAYPAVKLRNVRGFFHFFHVVNKYPQYFVSFRGP